MKWSQIDTLLVSIALSFLLGLGLGGGAARADLKRAYSKQVCSEKCTTKQYHAEYTNSTLQCVCEEVK